MPHCDVGDIQPFIRRLESFGSLSDPDKAALHDIGSSSILVPSGQDIHRGGKVRSGALVILEGFACRYKMSLNGVRNITAYILPGDYCDLDAAFLTRADHPIGALSTCRAMLVAPESMQNVLRRPALARALGLVTMAEFANACEWIVNIAGRSAVKRVAHLFCELSARLAVVGLVDNDGFSLPLTQTDLADTMGMSIVHMNRSIKLLRESGLIATKGRRLTILNLPGLQALGEFHPGYLLLQATSGVEPGTDRPPPLATSRDRQDELIHAAWN